MTFYWLGSESSEEDKETTAILARFTCDSVEGHGALIRVVEGHESAYFRRLFRGAMIMHRTVEEHYYERDTEIIKPEASKKKGSLFSSFFKKKNNPYDDDDFESLTNKLKKPAEGDDAEPTEFYIVKGHTAQTGYAIQLSLYAGELNSVDYFILSTPDVCYIRCPSLVLEEDRNMAYSLATFMSLRTRGVSPKHIDTFIEGKEPAAFWETLGGKVEYSPGYKEYLASGPARDPVIYVASSFNQVLSVNKVSP